MANAVVSGEINVKVSSAIQALGDLSKTFGDLQKSISSSMTGAVPTVQKASGEIGSLTDRIKAWRKEEVGEARQGRFLASQIAELIPVSGDAKNAIQGLATLGIGALGGVGINLALQALQTLSGLFQSATAKADELAKAFDDLRQKSAAGITAVVDDAQKLERQLAGKRASDDVVQKIDATTKAVAEREKRIADIQKRLSDIRKESERPDAPLRLPGIFSGPTEGDALREELKRLTKGDTEAQIPSLADLKGTIPGLRRDLAARREQESREDRAQRDKAQGDLRTLDAAFGSDLVQLQAEYLNRRAELNRKADANEFKDTQARDLAYQGLEKWHQNELRKIRQTREATDFKMFGPGNIWGEADWKQSQAEEAAALQARIRDANSKPFEFTKPGESLNASSRIFANAGDLAADQSGRANALAEAWRNVGEAVSAAGEGFMALGQAIGGQVGSIVGAMLQIITAAIKTAIAFASIEAAKTPFIGWAMAIGAAISMAATLVAVISGVQARAMGGSFAGGRPLLVGENGPELLLPSQGGYVVPNHRLGGNVNVTINGPVDREWWRANQGHILEQISDAARNRRYG